MSTVRIVTDSACDLSDEEIVTYAVTVVPLSIRFGEQEYVDRQDLTAQQFWAKVAASPMLPETAAPSPGAFEQAFRNAAKDGAQRIGIPRHHDYFNGQISFGHITPSVLSS